MSPFPRVLGTRLPTVTQRTAAAADDAAAEHSQLLLGANATSIALPVLSIAGLRVYDVFLLRQTERS